MFVALPPPLCVRIGVVVCMYRCNSVVYEIQSHRRSGELQLIKLYKWCTKYVRVDVVTNVLNCARKWCTTYKNTLSCLGTR